MIIEIEIPDARLAQVEVAFAVSGKTIEQGLMDYVASMVRGVRHHEINRTALTQLETDMAPVKADIKAARRGGRIE